MIYRPSDAAAPESSEMCCENAIRDVRSSAESPGDHVARASTNPGQNSQILEILTGKQNKKTPRFDEAPRWLDDEAAGCTPRRDCQV